MNGWVCHPNVGHAIIKLRPLAASFEAPLTEAKLYVLPLNSQPIFLFQGFSVYKVLLREQHVSPRLAMCKACFSIILV